jgi:uncharacterized protein YcbX
MSACRLAAIHRYPVKGLSPEPLAETTLPAGGSLPGDRLYAVENGPSGFDPAAPVHQPKIKYLMLMRNARLARLHTRYEDATTTLTLRHEGQEVRGRLDSAQGRADLEAFLAVYCADELRGPPRVLTAPAGYRFMDSTKGFVSLINLASVAALEQRVGQPVDPLRFRGNLHLEGLGAWQEFDLIGKVLAIGPNLRLRVTHRIDRCAATDVDPATGLRDLNLVPTLERAFGHHDCGVYAQVEAGGRITPGMAVSVVEPAPDQGLPF